MGIGKGEKWGGEWRLILPQKIGQKINVNLV